MSDQITPGLSDAKRALLERRLRGESSVSESLVIPRREAGSPAPLSFGQEQLWFLAQLAPDSAVYNELIVIRRQGPLNVRALERSLEELARRHEVWRTSFVGVENGPVQIVQPPTSYRIDCADISVLLPMRREEEATRLVRNDLLRPFDLAQGPLWRARLVRFEENEHRLYLTLHHIMFDGLSISRILAPELVSLYSAYASGEQPVLPEPRVRYVDFARWQRERVLHPEVGQQLTYWRNRLAELPVLQLRTDRPRPAVQAFEGAVHRFSIPKPLAEALAALGAREEATPYMVLLAAFLTVLQRSTGQEDLVLGILTSGRRQPELMNVFGYFVNPVVLRVDASGDPSFHHLISRVRDAVLGAVDNDEVPFEKLVKELRIARDPGRNPLFQVLFSLDPPSLGIPPGWAVSQTDIDAGVSKFDLSVDLEDRPEGIIGRLTYRTDLFETATIYRLAGSWRGLLEAVAEDADRRLSELPMVGEVDRRHAMVEFTPTQALSSRPCIHELFEEEARKRPQEVAVTFGDRELTYQELDGAANRLANHLRSLGVGPEVRVGICVDRSLEMMIGLLGILKAGGAYVPLDSGYPTARLAFMIEDTELSVLLTTDALRNRIQVSGVRLVFLDAEWASIAASPETPPVSETRPDSLAYVMYTSGSTGEPKGVMVEHRNVVRLVKPATYATLDSTQTLLQFAPLTFDASTFEIWGALLNGARLVISPPGYASIQELGELVKRQGVSILWLTAGLFTQLVESGLHHLSDVRELITGGEAVSPVHCARALEALPNLRLINGYGPTEATTFTCCHTIERGSQLEPSVPIGRPIGGTTVYNLDKERQPVSPGEAGELYIGGLGVARGYLKRPELTAERFLPDPFAGDSDSRLYRTGDLVRAREDGALLFLGRVDRQVKIRGHRVEPAEVEAVLSRHLDLREVAVETWAPTPDARRLVAYVVPRKGHGPDAGELRAFLKERLPDFMVPSNFVPLERLPLTPNGKVDRTVLPSPGTDREQPELAYLSPRAPEEEAIARIWRRILDVERIGVHDDFFELGGDSVLAVRMLAAVQRELGRTASAASIFQTGSTIAGLAALLGTRQSPAPNGALLVPVTQSRPVLFFLASDEADLVALRYFDSALGDDQPVLGLPPPRHNRRFDRHGGMVQLVEPLLAAVRARQPVGPYYICGNSLGGLIAYDVAGRLRSQGEQVAWLGLLDTLTPSAIRVASSKLRRLPRRFTNFSAQLRREGLKGTPTEFMGLLSRRYLRLRASLGLRLLPHQFDEAGAVAVALEHRVLPHDIPLEIFASSFRIWAAKSRTLGWEDLHEGPLDCHVFHDDRGELLREPSIEMVAKTLAHRLQETKKTTVNDATDASGGD